MQSKCPEILLNYENLIKLKAIILFQKLIHLVVRRRGNTSVPSGSPSARCWATASEETDCLREQWSPGVEGRGPPVSPLQPSRRCRCRHTSPRLWGRPCAQPEGKMWCPSLLPLTYLCLKSVSAQITASLTGTLVRELYNEQAAYQSGSRTRNTRTLETLRQEPRLLPTAGISSSSGKTSILLLWFFSLLEVPPTPDYQG